MVWAASPPLSLHLAVPWRSVTLWEGGQSSTVRDTGQTPADQAPAVSIPAGALDRIPGKGA